ncbi:hypothetical protein M011DRAFT_454924 [Sporormia fimetaria CBS 119925]|uniref:Uncharacterized protein n=1 Tax=Sporormia fimetaria CBS 119925 TaxID=1340428 RepID=A0A6A6VQI9_9PLEO|nr:hypothetical protein M011DRAFT_454924 [Sporormia fimetaria CBS 119925]
MGGLKATFYRVHRPSGHASGSPGRLEKVELVGYFAGSVLGRNDHDAVSDAPAWQNGRGLSQSTRRRHMYSADGVHMAKLKSTCGVVQAPTAHGLDHALTAGASSDYRKHSMCNMLQCAQPRAINIGRAQMVVDKEWVLLSPGGVVDGVAAGVRGCASDGSTSDVGRTTAPMETWGRCRGLT